MPHEHGFRPAIEQAIKDWAAANADKKLCSHDFLSLLAALTRTVEPILVGIGGDDAQFNALVADVEWAVETYIIPWDIPFLGAWAEKFADSQVKGLVRPSLELIRPKPHLMHGQPGERGYLGPNEWRAEKIA